MSRIRSVLRLPSIPLIISTFASLGLGLVSAAIQARILGPSGRGELAMAMTPGILVAMLLCLGLPDYFGRRAAAGDPLRHLSGIAVWMSIGIGAIAVAPYLLIVDSLRYLSGDARLLLSVFALTVPVFVYGYCLVGIAVGAGRWRQVAATRFLPQFLAVLGLVGFIWIRPTDVVLAVGVLLIMTGCVVPVIICLRSDVLPVWRWNLREPIAALRFGLRGWVAGSVALLNQRIDLLMVTAMLPAAAVGYYAVGTTLATVLTAVANAIAMPTRNAVVRGETSAIAASSSVSLSTTLLGAACAAPLMPWLTGLVLGPAFLGAVPLFIALTLAQIPLAGIVVLTQSLVGHGRPGTPFFGELGSLLVSVALTILLVPAWGAIGAAAAVSIGRSVNLIVLIVLTRRLVRKDAWWRYLLPSRTAIRQFLTLR